MKSGFAKELVERERYGSSASFRAVRHAKEFRRVDEYFGGHEGMRRRHKIAGYQKTLNENLNPLWGWLRSCVGKNWDKCYSQLRKQFDARNVINNHILEHLWQEVEKDTFIGDKGQVMFCSTYRWADKIAQPISASFKDYYICPKTNTLKKTKKQPRRSVIKQREAEKLKAQLAKKRVLEDGTELRKEADGIWYLYTFAELPKANMVYTRPHGITQFKIGYELLGTGITIKTWDELNEQERARFGNKTYDVKSVHDADGQYITPSTKGPVRYTATKKTAPRALLRKHDLDGTATTVDKPMSHREASKYREH